MRADQDLDGFIDVVVWVQWQCQGTEVTELAGYSAEIEGALTFTLDPSQPFIPMYELTDEIVLTWVWDSGVNKSEIEAQVQALIDQQKLTASLSPPQLAEPT